MSIVWKKTICIADKNDMDTLIKLDNETHVEIYLEPHECPDFLVDNTTGQITPQVKSVCINGTQWNLIPGKNMVPESVYQLLISSKQHLQQARQSSKPRCIGRF